MAILQQWQFPLDVRRQLDKLLARFDRPQLLTEDLRISAALYLLQDPQSRRGALSRTKHHTDRLLDALGQIHGVEYWRVNRAAFAAIESDDPSQVDFIGAMQ